MKSIAQRIHKTIKHEWKDPYFKAFLILFIIAAFIRLVNLDGFVTYLGDQGRDAIIIRRIVTFEHFPAVGATSSVGGVFLGPFYYYFIAPWLLLFNFDPIGLAAGVAFSSIISIAIIYFMVKDLFNKQIALLTSLFFMFTHVVVEASRFSWNPNLLPYFSFFSLYFFVKGFKTHRLIFYLLAGLFLSFSMQLHYIMLALFAPLGLAALYLLISSKKKQKDIIGVITLVASFVLGTLPLIIFDLRHESLNIKNFIKVVFGGGGSSGGFSFDEILRTFSQFNSYLFTFNIPHLIALAIGILLVIFAILSLKKNKKIALISSTFLIGLIATSHFTSHKLSHYFGALYPYYFVITSYVLHEFLWKSRRKVILAFVLFVFMALQSRMYYFLFGTPNYQIGYAESISKVIYEKVSSEKYQVTGIPDYYDDNAYRYFLEVWGKRPLAKDSLERGTELFAVCEKECMPLKAKQWSISYFEPKKIVESWKVEGVTIYKLTN